MLHSRTLRWCLAASALLVVITLAGRWLFRAPSAFPPLPEPNGYAVVARAAAGLQDLPDGFKTLETDQLAKVVARNQDTLEQVRRALDLPGAVPAQYSESWFTVHSVDLRSLKTAAVALHADSALRQRRGDHHEALLAAVDGLRLSEMAQRGGVLLDHLVGTACEMLAWSSLTNLVDSLSGADCRLAAQALVSFEARREPFDAIRRREREWSRRSYGVFTRIGHAIRSGTLGPDKATRQMESNAVTRIESRIRANGVLTLRLAARAHALEKGAAPKAAADLVPAYLPRLPLDPATGRPLELP